jgi:Spy/CpxP family protein refolding chaperone
MKRKAMDWINQNRLKTGLIAALLILNVITISMIWMQTSGPDASLPRSQDRRMSESASLMKTALDLTDEQTVQFSSMLKSYHEEAKIYNDRLTALKKQLADELFNGSPDSSVSAATAREIGEVQAKVEVLRFQHFQRFIAICTAEQRENLRPIVTELFARKPPREEPGVTQPQKTPTGQTRTKGNVRDEGTTRVEDPSPRASTPPSVDERLSKYSSRLTLSGEQEQKVRAVMEESRKKGEQLRDKKNPDPGEIEMEKEKIRRQEDQAIRTILDKHQQVVFDDMVMKRNPDRH